MNRAERRKQAMVLKNKKQSFSHLHSKYSENDLNKVRDQVREFLKTYDFKGSGFEKSYEYEMGVKQIREMCGNSLTIRLIDDVDESIMTLETKYPIVIDIEKDKSIETDIFLVKEKNGWFIHYDKLGFSQNLLILILEMGFDRMMNNEINGDGRVFGCVIPCINNLARKAFDRLSLRYGSEWVNL